MALAEQTVQYIKTLAQSFGLDEKALVAKAEADENARKALDIVPRATFSAELDKVRDKTRTDMRGEFDTWKGEYYQKEVLPRWNQREQDLQRAQQEAQSLKAKEAAYKALYGDLDGFNPQAPIVQPQQPQQPVVAQPGGQPQYMTREESAQLAAMLSKEMTRAGLQYYSETGKVLDVDKFEEHVVKGQYQGKDAIRRALDDFVKPERDAKDAAARQTEKEQYAQQKLDEWKSQHAIPLDTAPPTSRGSALFRQPSKDEADAAALADPQTPKFVKDELMRKSFMQDLGPATLAGALTGR